MHHICPRLPLAGPSFGGPIALLSCALIVLPVLPASAAITDTGDPGWAGPAGPPEDGTPSKKPVSPVSDVTMRFTVPTLNCNSAVAEEKVSIWVGMDSSQAGNPLTQAGLIGWCLKGDFMDWHGFYETVSNSTSIVDPPAQTIPAIGHIQPGSVVTVRLDYVPNVAPDLFLSEIKVWNGSALVKSATQYIQSPYWASRARGECITERTGGKAGGGRWPVAHFADFTASCVVGATTGTGARVSSFLPDKSSVSYVARDNLWTTFITVTPQNQFSMKFHWLRS